MALLALPGDPTFEALVRALQNAFDAIETHERWHTIGVLNEPAFESNWTNEDSTFYIDAAFRRNALGDVQFFGQLEATAGGAPPEANGAVAWHFPEGYRPREKAVSFPITGMAGGTAYPGIVVVGADGSVTPTLLGLAANTAVDSATLFGRFRAFGVNVAAGGGA